MKTAIVLPLCLLMSMLSSSLAWTEIISKSWHVVQKVASDEKVAKVLKVIGTASSVLYVAETLKDTYENYNPKTESEKKDMLFKVRSAEGEKKAVAAKDLHNLIEEGAAAVIGIGYGIKKLTERTKKKGAVLPGSDYIGPGNPVRIDAPKNEAEVVAKEHDVEYLHIQTNKYKTRHHHFAEVSKADAKAIEGFKKTKGVKARIGEYGLRVKSYAENTLRRSLYPQYKSGDSDSTDGRQLPSSPASTSTSSPCRKLELEKENVKIYLEDGTEIDDDKLLNLLPDGTILYFLREFDKKPWMSDTCSEEGCP